MNDTRDEWVKEPTDELGRSKRLLRLMNEPPCDLARHLLVGFAVSFVACWLGYEVGRRECAR